MSALQWDRQSLTAAQRRINELRRRITAAEEKALGAAGAALLDDAKNISPTIPKASAPMGGALREAGQLHIGGDYVDLVFDLPYAAVMHAGRWATGPLAGVSVTRWSEPGSGPFWLSEKLRRFGEKYVKLMSKTIQDEVGM